MNRLIAILVIVFSALVSTAADFKIGDKVFVKPEAVATIVGKPVDVEKIPRPSAISKVDGDKVLLGKAWVLIKDVMTAEEAVEFYNEQIRNDPTNSMLFVHRGKVRGTKNDLDGAFEDFNEAIRLDPTNAKAYRGRGNTSSKKSDLDNAIKDTTEAIRLDPTDAIGLLVDSVPVVVRVRFVGRTCVPVMEAEA